MNREMLQDQLEQVQMELLLIKKEIDKVYKNYTHAPYEQIRHIPLDQFVKTRYITLEEHNQLMGAAQRENFYE